MNNRTNRISNMINFKILGVLSSVLFFYLFYLLFFDSMSLFNDLGIAATETAFFISRRASMLMLGFGFLLIFGRNIKDSLARQIISLSVCVSMTGLSLTGMYEFGRGFVSNDIFISMIVEIILAALYFHVWRTNIPEAG